MPFGSQIAPSYWEKSSFLKDRDVIIVGSGIVGLTAAIEVKKRRPDWSVLVIERGTLPSGASTKNAGFACIGSPSELLLDAKEMGWEPVLQLIKQRWEGLMALRKLVGDKGLQFQPTGGYELFVPEQEDLFERCTETIIDLNKNLEFAGPNYFMPEGNPNSLGLSKFAHVIYSPHEGSIHPGSMMQALLKICRSLDIDILTGFNVEGMEESANDVTVHSGSMKVSGRLALLATNAFAKELISSLDVRPARNQVLLTSKIPNLALQGTFHHDHGFLYFRNLDGRVLIGGARNHFKKEESTKEFGNTGAIMQYLTSFLKTHVLPDTHFEVEHQWSGILGLGGDKSPITQWSSDRIFTACRLSGIGVAIGTSIGQSAATQILSR